MANPAQPGPPAYAPGGRRGAAARATTAPARCPSVGAMRLRALGIKQVDLAIAAALILLLLVGTTGASSA